jgi:hypothetical protein
VIKVETIFRGIPEIITREEVKREEVFALVVSKTYQKTSVKEEGDKVVVEYKLIKEEEVLFVSPGC